MSGFAGIAPAVKKLAAEATPGAPASPLLGPPAPTPVTPNLSDHPAGPPVPLFQHLGSPAPLSVPEFNQRLHAVTAAHVAATGYMPSPQDALHAVLNPDQAQALGRFAAQTAGPSTVAALQQHPVAADEQFVDQLRAAAQTGEAAYNTFVVQNSQRLAQLQHDPAWKSKVNGIINNAVGVLHPAGPANQNPVVPARALTPKDVEKMGILNAQPSIISTAVKQIVSSLVFAPVGAFYAAKAVGEDVGAAAQGNESFQHTRALGTAIGHSFVVDAQHPKQNPGYLFLDLLGLASLGAGAEARTAAALGRTGAEEGRVATLLRRPPLQTVPVKVGDYTEHMPLSSNPLIAQVQKMVVGVKQAHSDLNRDGAAPDFWDQTLSYPRKVGREAEARMRIEHNALMAPAEELRAAAGSSRDAAQVFHWLGPTITKGLARGEQKAIQAASWDIDGTIEDKIAAETKFHQSMIDQGIGDPKAHQRQIADLKLAAKAVENPSKRLKQSMILTARLMTENDRLRTEELGLAPLTAEGRIAKAAQVLREEPLVGGAKREPGSFYLPTQPKGKVKRGPSQARGRFGVSGNTPFGISPGRNLPELTHEFTGDALRAGNYRIDATNLATEAYARTARAVTVKNQWKKLWESAHDAKQGQWDIPIRDANTIPDKLRETVAKLDEGFFHQKDADVLPQDMHDLIRELYPPERDLAPDQIDHVKWVDSRLIGDTGAVVPPWWVTTEKALNLVNTPIRFASLYLRPAYALNLLGNHAMLWFDQGFTTSLKSYARALALHHTDGDVNTALIHRLVGAGKTHSYHSDVTGHMTRAVAEFWNNFADRDERSASWLYYADRKGYRTAEERNALLHSDDPKAKADLAEVTRRANKALVEFDNLTPIEKNVIRHIIFVYPWVRGATVWSLRAIMEHPAKVALLAHLGQEAEEHDPFLKGAPSWFKQIGYVPLGYDHHGHPIVANPTSINTFATLQDLLAAGEAVTTRKGNETSQAEDMLGPAFKFFLHAETGRDQYGNKYPDGAAVGAMRDILLNLPQLSTFGIGKKHKPPAVAPFKITDRSTLQTHVDAALHQTIFGPGWLDGFGSLLAGGLSPRAISPAALKARGISELTPAARVQRELALLNRALTLQGEFLQQPVPDKVRVAVRAAAETTKAAAEFHKQTGRAPTEKERVGLYIDTLAKAGAIPATDAAKLHKGLLSQNDQTLSTFKKKLLVKYAAANQLHQWDRDVRALYSFRHSVFNEKAADLFTHGLSPARTYKNRKQADLYAYGRGYVKYQQGLRALKARKASSSEIRMYEDDHAKPVDGFPSYAAIDFANRTPEEQAKTVLRDSYSSWSSLSSTEKALVGKPVNPAVSEAWHAYDTVTSPGALAKQLPVGQRSLAKDQRYAVVKQIDRYYDLHGAFTKDYLFSREPLFQRLQYLTLVKASPHRSDWVDLFRQAATLETAVKAGNTTQTAADDAWRDYTTQLPGYYESENPAFWKEIKPIMQAHPDFLNSLIH